MIRICMKCNKVMGEKEPFEDKSETHGYCDPCLKIELRQIKKVQRKMKKDPAYAKASAGRGLETL